MSRQVGMVIMLLAAFVLTVTLSAEHVDGALHDGDLTVLVNRLEKREPKALGRARRVYEQWAEADPESVALMDFNRRLEAMRSLVTEVRQGLAASELDRTDVLLDAILDSAEPTVRPAATKPETLSSAAEVLYARYQPEFVYPLDATGLTAPQRAFLVAYYNAEANALVMATHELGGIAALDADQAVQCDRYFLLLPLLYAHQNFGQESLKSLPSCMLTPQRLNQVADWCLLRLGRLDAATVLRMHGSRTQDEQGRYEVLCTMAQTCKNAGQFGQAVQCLQKAEESLKSNDPRHATARFQICEFWAATKNYALAAGEAGQIAKSDVSPDAIGRALSLRIGYLAQQGDHAAVLREVDDALSDERCQPYEAELLYLRWKSLRFEGDGALASQTLKKYLTANQNGVHAAEMYYAVAVDCLSAQRYVNALDILRVVTSKYPDSPEAKRAKPLIEKLSTFMNDTRHEPAGH